MISSRDIATFAATLLITVLGLGLMLATGMVTDLSKETPIADPSLDYAWGAAVAIALGAATFAFPLDMRERLAIATVWCIKAFVTLVAMPYYEAFYVVLDAFAYYQLPATPTFTPDPLHVGQGTENLYGLIWLLYRVMPDSYHALKVLFSFVGLVGIVLFYRAAVAIAGRGDIRILYLLALFPSMLFWSSILGKEPIALAAIGLYAHGTVRWLHVRSWHAALCVAAGIIIAMYVRAWLAPILVAPLAILYLVAAKGVLTRLALGAALAVTFFLSFAQLSELFAVETAQDLLLTIEATSQLWATGGSGLVLDFDLRQPTELFAAFPLAAFTALFRPLPGEVQHVFGTIAGLENLALLLASALALKRFRLADLRLPLVAWALALLAVWTLAYAFVSYQNLGAAVRFRLQVLPFLLGLLAFFARRTVTTDLPPGASGQAAVS